VTNEDVYVRSGPGDDYYPTEKLKLGQEVEVYRHDPGGWFAIRPPEGSFTWVAARYLDRQKDNLATVNAERVAGRVGSRFSDIRDVIQVRLQKGETVEILQSDPRELQGEKGWCKIAPPSGEFRWIFGKYVDPDDVHNGVHRHRPPINPTALHEPDPREPPPFDPPPRDADRHAPDHRPEHLAMHRAERDVERLPPAEYVEPGPPPPLPDRRRDAEPLSSVTPAPMRRLRGDEFTQEIDDLELELSIMVAEEPTVWSFERIGPRARALLEQSETAVERGRARLLVSKVARFEEIKQRSDSVNQIWRNTERRNEQLTELSRRRAESVRVRSVDDRFDGVGKLARLPATAAGTPHFALMEPNGQVRCYVTPAPGVNLQNYVGREVGIHGVRGFMPEQQAQHIVAKHVTPVDDTRLR
jgi:SH3-like domain-containing protein